MVSSLALGMEMEMYFHGISRSPDNQKETFVFIGSKKKRAVNVAK